MMDEPAGLQLVTLSEMTEADWLACAEPGRMLEFLGGTIDDRKLRLLVCGLCRRVWYLLGDRAGRPARRAVEVAEDFADGAASADELAEAQRAVWDLWNNWPRIDRLRFRAVSAAAWVARPDVGEDTALRVLEYSLTAEARLAPEDARRDRCDLIRDLFGNPFRPVFLATSWLTPAVLDLARAVYEERAFDRLLALADALEGAGCTSAELLAHCREPGEHARGCWAVDRVLGRVGATKTLHHS